MAENVHAVLVQAVQHVPKKWANVRGVFLKTTDSVALPLFQCLPEHAGTRIEPAAAGAVAAAGAGAAGAVAAAPQGKSQKPVASAAKKAVGGVSIAGKGRPAVQAPATPGAKKLRKA